MRNGTPPTVQSPQTVTLKPQVISIQQRILFPLVLGTQVWSTNAAEWGSRMNWVKVEDVIFDAFLCKKILPKRKTTKKIISKNSQNIAKKNVIVELITWCVSSVDVFYPADSFLKKFGSHLKSEVYQFRILAFIHSNLSKVSMGRFAALKFHCWKRHCWIKANQSNITKVKLYIYIHTNTKRSQIDRPCAYQSI